MLFFSCLFMSPGCLVIVKMEVIYSATRTQQWSNYAKYSYFLEILLEKNDFLCSKGQYTLNNQSPKEHLNMNLNY